MNKNGIEKEMEANLTLVGPPKELGAPTQDNGFAQQSADTEDDAQKK
jgi:hypothetical protein